MGPRFIVALLFGALAIAARLPFLMTGKVPFDSDEAVQGLMARHVLTGELPAFFWGQPFKGVPEVYAAAGAFALFGSSVTALKRVTLAVFAMYVALNFVLLDKIASRWVAVSASLLLIIAPPALVFWSLWAGAEYMFIMMMGTTLLLISERAKSTERRDKGLPFATGFVIGFALWDHQLFVMYLIPLGIILAIRGEWWKRGELRRPNRLVMALTAMGALYIFLGVIAFITGGFSLRIGSTAISATAPQKMIRIAAGILTIAGLTQLIGTATLTSARAILHRYWPVAAGLVIGYAPALLYAVFVEPPRSPVRVIDARGLIQASPDIFGNIVPILAGFKTGTTERLPVPPILVLPGAAALAVYVWSTRHVLTKEFFPLFVLFVPVFFLVSGAYLDTQSHRYLIPWYAGLSIAWAAGSLELARRVRLSAVARAKHASFGETRRSLGEGGKPGTTNYVASLIVAAILAVHAWQQVAWYQKLQPDTQTLATIDCLKSRGIHGGYAEYWTAYKMTFLAREDIIIAPTDGVNRYPKYTDYVESLPANQQVRLKADTSVCQSN